MALSEALNLFCTAMIWVGILMNWQTWRKLREAMEEFQRVDRQMVERLLALRAEEHETLLGKLVAGEPPYKQ